MRAYVESQMITFCFLMKWEDATYSFFTLLFNLTVYLSSPSMLLYIDFPHSFEQVHSSPLYGLTIIYLTSPLG